MFKRLAITFLFLAPLLAPAQEPGRKFVSSKALADHLEIQTSDGLYLIKPYSAKTVETSFIPQGERYEALSHAVVETPQAIKADVKESADALDYGMGGDGLVVHISKAPFSIAYFYRGKPVIAEKGGYARSEGRETLSFGLDNTEALYGGGARALGMNRRGNRLRLYNKADYGYETHSELMNFTMPLVLSSKIYAIHFDNPQIGYLDLDSRHDNTLVYETIGGRKTYQVIVGDNWAELLGNYTTLTGRQPLPPRWAFGNFASRFGYHSEAEARRTLDLYAVNGIPVDAIIFDLYWFSKEIKGSMGDLAFRKEDFPDPKRMIADFNKRGVKTVLVTEPFILTTSKRWNEAVQEKILATDKAGKPFTYDFYFGHTGLIDIFGDAGRNWFWNIYKDLAKEDGVAGWWGDLGEPEVHPADLQHATGSADQVHNIYGHNWARLIADGYRKDFPERRPFILMRSGYSGSQRFGLIPWSGDVNRSWGGLQSQPEIALQMGMQGMAYMHSDLGGFANPNLDDELYTRWLQYGVFQPVFRPHAQEEVPSEPVYRDAPTMELAKQAVLLRYSLMPYNYTLAFENSRTGMPLMRPLFFAEPGNEALEADAQSYMWGDAFLVTPIVKPGVKEQPVYFPAGSNWIDFYSGTVQAGGTSANVAVAPEHIPVYVKGGAFVPMIAPIANTTHYSTRNFTLHYYFDETVKASSGELYDDDGKTPNAADKGEFELMHFTAARTGKALTISLAAEQGRHFRAGGGTLELVMHNIAVRPDAVKLDGRALPYQWVAAGKTLQVRLPWQRSKQRTLEVGLAGKQEP
jgi:alpha-glucosidase (family GH31 glycosyl hydrolase)